MRATTMGWGMILLAAGCGEPGAGADATEASSGTNAVETGSETSLADSTGTDASSSTGEASEDGPADASSSGGSSTGAIEPEFADEYPLMAQFPEGGAYDPTGHAFFVGSLETGTLHRVDAQTGAEEIFFEPTVPGVWRTLGISVDDERRAVWVCAIDDPENPGSAPYDGYVWRVDADTGERTIDAALDEAAPGGSCNDVAHAPDGVAYVTDRELPHIYRIDDSGVPQLWVDDPALDSGGVGQNGIVVLPDSSAVITTNYIPPRLTYVSLPDGATIHEVDISGDFINFELGAGADGMIYADGALYVAFSAEIAQVTPTVADWTQAQSVTVDVPSGQTDVVSTPEGLYLLNGQAIAFVFGDEPELPFRLVRLLAMFE